MADLRRIVTLPGPTVVLDLQQDGVMDHVRDSWVLAPSERRPIIAADQRRYGGAYAANELHDNGSISWTALIAGATADAAVVKMEQLLSVLEQPRTDLFYEWRADGATSSVFYEIRGPSTYKPTYGQVSFAGARFWTVDVTTPIGPLGQTASYKLTPTVDSTTGPKYLTLPGAITGNAPAPTAVQFALQGMSATDAPSGIGFGLVAWSKRPVSPRANVPFGTVDAESSSVFRVNMTVASNSDARGGAVAVAGTGASAYIEVDPAAIGSDPFRNTVDIEVWARFLVDTTPRTARLRLAGRYGHADTYGELGATARPVTPVASGTGFRICRLGIVTLPTSTAVATSVLRIEVDQGLALDYVVMVPARRRALTPTGKIQDSITQFLPNNAVLPFQRKTVMPNLTSTLSSSDFGTPNSTPAPSTGLGGTQIELPPGDVDLLVWLDVRVPDDPTVAAPGQSTTPGPTFVEATVTPRFWLAAS